ncbi:MAG: insulinase family protein [Prevotellaceae bacterium]|jgi:predicted Zn-dependent peptidase|nr:insulinase family protein [Prevotellaceae bacterium]
MEFETFTLSNGLRFVHKRVKSAVAYCGLTVNVGTRDELEHEHGMAHFLEHMFFKGTKKRSSLRISSLLESRGGDLNAFTTKEETAVHAVVLRGDLSKAFDIISDIVFNPTFPPAELEKEKAVVCDEINLYLDNPSDTIFDEFEKMMFPASSLGRSILGSASSLYSFSQQGVQSFVNRCYTTDRMVFSSVGSFGVERVARLAAKYFAHLPGSVAQIRREPLSGYSVFGKECRKSTHQAHCLLGNRAFDYAHDSRFALHLLVNLLGGPSQNSRLSLALRETHGLAYGVEVASTLYSDCGVTTVYFGTEKNSVEKCLRVVDEELEKLRSDKLTPAQLRLAKRQMLGQILIGSESNEHTMLNMGKSLLAYGKVNSSKEIEERIRAVTAEQVQELACEIFNPKKMSSLIYR